MNFFIIHGGNGGTDASRGNWLKNQLTPYGEVISPSFPLAEQATPQSRKLILNQYIYKITPDSIFICHSIGCLFTIKYLVANQLPIKAIIFVAGPGGTTITNKDKEKKKRREHIMIPFLPTRTVKKKFQQLVHNRFAIYSDNDHILHIRSLKAFATSINAQPLFIPNKGHFGRLANIQEIPEIMEILRPYLPHL